MNSRIHRRPEQRSSLGDLHVETAIGDINRLQTRAVALMSDYDISREDTLPMLFRDGDLHKLKQVHGMVEARLSVMLYTIQPGVSLHIDFTGAQVPSIEAEWLYLQPDRTGPLLNYIAAVKAVHEQYEEVKAVLRWLNRNATPGAIRFYWPTAMNLTKSSPIWRDLQQVPSRCNVPAGLSDWIQPIKDSANTMAAAAMMPDTLTRPRGTMGLSFAPIRHPSGRYTTDQRTYNV
jgi:hypothetical protein